MPFAQKRGPMGAGSGALDARLRGRDDEVDGCQTSELCTLARIENLGRSDLVKVDCAACHHVALLTPEFLLRLGSALWRRCLISSGASGAAAAKRGGEPSRRQVFGCGVVMARHQAL